MVPPEQVDAIVVAAGRGERMGQGPKAWLVLGGRTLLERAVALARQVAARTVVGVAPADVERARALLPADTVIVQGGATRRDTTLGALAAGSAPWILLHDVAHPFVTPELARAVIEAAAGHGAAVGAVQSQETAYHRGARGRVRRMGPGEVWLQRRPYVLRRRDLAQGLTMGHRLEGYTALLHRVGVQTEIVPAPSWNIKLTTPEDWTLALAIEDRIRPV